MVLRHANELCTNQYSRGSCAVVVSLGASFWTFPKLFPSIMLLRRSTHSERQEPNEFCKQMVLLNHDVFGHKRRCGILNHEKKKSSDTFVIVVTRVFVILNNHT